VRKSLEVRCVDKDDNVKDKEDERGKGSGDEGNGEEFAIALRFRDTPPQLGAQHVTFSLKEPIPARASTCAVVLPKGTKFSAESGELPEDLRVPNLVGRQPFYVRLQPNLRDVSYQTYEIAFPHGLEDPKRAIEALKDLVVISPAQETPPSVLLNPSSSASILIRVPTLQPEHSYLFSLKASDKVKDVYGQPLIGSSTGMICFHPLLSFILL
jgi:hypothetical protein